MIQESLQAGLESRLVLNRVMEDNRNRDLTEQESEKNIADNLVVVAGFDGISKRLAREHFDRYVVDKFDELGANDYVDFLKAKGYKEPRIGGRAFANEPEYVVKERHLLNFFKQSYEEDPRESVQRFREFYQNSEPEMRILTYGKDKDTSKLKKLELPSQTRLYSFGITEHMNRATPYSNDLCINRTSPSSGDVHFWCRASVDSPILLHLQEYTCKEMGINFR
ncbi:MAG: hypothetical protein WC548_01500 [Candidatus Pacearchaeota archaeon]